MFLQTQALPQHADKLEQGVLLSSSSGLSLWHHAWAEVGGTPNQDSRTGGVRNQRLLQTEGLPNELKLTSRHTSQENESVLHNGNELRHFRQVYWDDFLLGINDAASTRHKGMPGGSRGLDHVRHRVHTQAKVVEQVYQYSQQTGQSNGIVCLAHCSYIF